jgi:nucleotide-binding universal stress UspA family protein
VFQGRPIVVGVNGSPESVRAARVAWTLSQALRGPCHLVHAVGYPVLDSTFGIAPASLSPVFEQLLAAARRDLEVGLAGSLPAEALAGLEVRLGRPARALAQAATERGAGLVVVGGKPHGAVARLMGGSTAHGLAHLLEVPLLVTSRLPHPIARILVAVDLSDAAPPTLAVAGALSEALGARLRVIYAVEPLRLPAGVELGIDREDLYERQVAAFAELVAGVAHVPPIDRVTRRGPAAEMVTEEVASWEADLLVVGSHGKGWVDRLMIGSTTERLLALLPTSLVIVPAWVRESGRAARARAGRRRGRRRAVKGGVA